MLLIVGVIAHGSSAEPGRPLTPSVSAAVQTPPLPHRAVRLPEGVPVEPVPDGFVARRDLLAGWVHTPNGWLAIDDYFYKRPQVRVRVRPGRHYVRITLADSAVDSTRKGYFALATIVTGSGAPVSWHRVGTLRTAGGVGGFASTATARALARDDGRLHNQQLAALDASPDAAARVILGNYQDLVMWSFGAEGRFPVYAGTDADGNTVRVVVDGGALKLDWP
jgi:hypothetical protein